MSVFNDLLFGLSVALTPTNMVIAVVGLILGTAIGVLPGLGGTNGVALLLPLPKGSLLETLLYGR